MALSCGRHDIQRFSQELDPEDVRFWIGYCREFPIDDSDGRNINFAKLMLHLDDILAVMHARAGVTHQPMKLGSLLPKRLRPKKKKAIELQSQSQILGEIQKIASRYQ